MATDVIGEADIREAQPEVTLDETLQQVPGLVVNNRQNFALGERLVIRGIGSRAQFGVRGIKILVDDIPLTLPDGQAQTGNIDLSTTGRIEVVRGPASSLYGNAAGGVIHFHTQQDRSASPWQVRARALTGSFGLQKWIGTFRGHTASSQYVIGADQMSTQGFRDHSASRIRHLNAVWRTQFSDRNRVTLVGNLYDAPYLLNPSTLSKTDARTSPAMARQYIISQGAGEQAQQGQAGVTWQHNFGPTQFLKTTLYGIRRSLVNPIPGRIIGLERLAGGFRSFYQVRFPLLSFRTRFSAGVDLEFQNDRRHEYQNQGIPEESAADITPSRMFRSLQYGALLIHQRETVQGIGPFLQMEVRLHPRVWVLAGGRYDRYRFGVRDHLDAGTDHSGNRTMQHFSPMIGWTYALLPEMSLYGNISTAFQTPTTGELGNRPSGEGGFNPNLRPENVVNYEIGARGGIQPAAVSYGLAAYILDIRDMLIPYQVDPLSDEVFHKNAGAARNAGVEAQAAWDLNPRFSTRFTYTYQHFTFTDFQWEYQVSGQLRREQLAGKEVPGVPRQQLHWALSYQHPAHIFGRMELQWTDRYFANNFNGPPPDQPQAMPRTDYVNAAHTVVNLRAGIRHPLGRITATLFGGVDNLLDQRYNASIVPNAFGGRYFEPAPGRHWYLGVEILFRRPAGS